MTDIYIFFKAKIEFFKLSGYVTIFKMCRWYSDIKITAALWLPMRIAEF